MTARNLLVSLMIFWCLLFLLLQHGCERDLSVRTPEFLMDMNTSAAYQSQESNPVFDDGRNLRLPVPGTIVRGFMPFPYGDGLEEAKRAGQELVNPFKPDPANLERGARNFKIYCAVCHGEGGKGDGTVTKRGVPPPPSLLLENAKKMPDGEIYHAITLGRNNMPSHGAQIGRDDRWKTILYVRKLQGVLK